MKFYVHREPERFVKVLASYIIMSNAELGFNTFMKRNGNGKYIPHTETGGLSFTG